MDSGKCFIEVDGLKALKTKLGQSVLVVYTRGSERMAALCAVWPLVPGLSGAGARRMGWARGSMAAQGRNTKRLAGLQVGPAESSGCRWKNQQARPTCTDQQAASTNRQTSTDCTFSDPPFFKYFLDAALYRC